MNLKIIRLRATLLLSNVLAFFDRGLDGAVDAFTKADRKLEAFKSKLDAQLDREQDLIAASYDRQAKVDSAERARRSASFGRQDNLLTQRTRARAIQGRIADLLK